MIIGLAGTIGSGKGTVVAYLQEKGFSHYSSSDILKEIVAERGQLQNRKNLSVLADELSSKHVGGILHLSHERAEKDGAENYILEAIHRQNEADYIKSLGGYVLGVDADVRTRYDRISKRREGEKDNVSFDQFLADAEREDEGKAGGLPNIKAVLRNADFIIQNDSTLEELHAQIDQVLEKIGHED